MLRVGDTILNTYCLVLRSSDLGTVILPGLLLLVSLSLLIVRLKRLKGPTRSALTPTTNSNLDLQHIGTYSSID